MDAALLSMCVSGAKFVPTIKREGQRRPLFSSSIAGIKIVCSSIFFFIHRDIYQFQHRSAAGVVQLCGKIYALGGHNGLSIFDSVEVRQIGTLCGVFVTFFGAVLRIRVIRTYVSGHPGS